MLPGSPFLVRLSECAVVEVKLRSEEEAERMEEYEEELHEVVVPPPVLQVDDFELPLLKDEESLRFSEVEVVPLGF